MGPSPERLLTEMAEQPQVVAALRKRPPPALSAVADRIRSLPSQPIVIVARGSSDHAAIFAKYLLEIRARRVVSLAAPSTVTLYGSGPRLEQTVVVGISQSGRGDDVISYVRGAREQGAYTVAVVNDPSSPLAQAAEVVLELGAGEEISVPATKTVAAQMALVALLSEAVAGQSSDPLAALPEALERALAMRDRARSLAEPLRESFSAAVVGRGFAYAAALETALKLKEMAKLHAEAFSGADFFHGPVALVRGQSVVVVDAGGVSTAPAMNAAAEIHRRGGTPILVRVGTRLGQAPFPSLDLEADLPEVVAPIAAIAMGQVLAYELALLRGTDPSAPAGLQKVTSTR